MSVLVGHITRCPHVVKWAYLHPEVWSALSPIQKQFLYNVIAYADHLGVDLGGLAVEQITQPPEMAEVIMVGDTTALVYSLGKNFSGKIPGTHPGFEANYRQEVMKWSMQINVSHDRCSFDIDKWNPNYGAFPAFMHLFAEVIPDAITHGDTDQREVAAALRKMGIKVADYEVPST